MAHTHHNEQVASLAKLNLPQLKEVAATECMDPAWASVGREQREELRELLASRRRQMDAFVESVCQATKVHVYPPTECSVARHGAIY